MNLNLAGLGRRGLPGVHGKEELEHSGASSPLSGISVESSKTVGSRLRGWTRTEVTAVNEELNERIEEIEVERGMERGLLEEEKEIGDMRIVGQAGRALISGEEHARPGSDSQAEARTTTRLVLRSPGLGKVVCLKVVEGLGLVVLRDIG